MRGSAPIGEGGMGRGGAGSPSNTMWPGPSTSVVARAQHYLHVKFHIDPLKHLATVHERYRQTGQTDRQTTV